MTRIGEPDSGQDFERTLVHFRQMRRLLAPEQWNKYTAAFKEHPMHQVLCQCPFHRRAFQKPRGYAGDGIVLDFIYGIKHLPADTSPIGEQFYRWQFEQAACRSVRARRNFLAQKIDSVADKVGRPRILSLSCGHLREAQQSRAVAGRRIGQFFAVDQDADNLDLVNREQSANGIETIYASVRSFLARKSDFQNLDLVYSAGLFNYLADPIATSLTRTLFDMIRPGGSILIANFAPNLPDIGMMEASMDWRLTYRDEAACDRLTREIEGCYPRLIFRDQYHNIVFVEVGKRG